MTSAAGPINEDSNESLTNPRASSISNPERRRGINLRGLFIGERLVCGEGLPRNGNADVKISWAPSGDQAFPSRPLTQIRKRGIVLIWSADSQVRSPENRKWTPDGQHTAVSEVRCPVWTRSHVSRGSGIRFGSWGDDVPPIVGSVIAPAEHRGQPAAAGAASDRSVVGHGRELARQFVMSPFPVLPMSAFPASGSFRACRGSHPEIHSPRFRTSQSSVILDESSAGRPACRCLMR